MTRTQYLYGKPPSYFKGMLVEECSHEKIRLARETLNILWDTPLTERDNFKVNKLIEAMKHHEYLLNELDEYEEGEDE